MVNVDQAVLCPACLVEVEERRRSRKRVSLEEERSRSLVVKTRTGI